MSQVRVQGNASGTGVLTVTSPNTNSNYTLTLPAETGTILTTVSGVAVNGPAFRAYATANQSISASTITKVVLDAESFDTASCFNNTGSTVGSIPAYAFLPNVAGYYQVNAKIFEDFNGAGNSGVRTYLYKNGSNYSQGSAFGGNLYATLSNFSELVYLNGTTDYIELYGWSNHGSPQFNGTSPFTSFSAFLARAA